MDGTLQREDGRYVLRFERHLRHPVERVWRAVTETSELAHWFPGQVDFELRQGGKALFGHAGFDVDPELLPTAGVVEEVDPPRLLAFTWGDDLLRIELVPEETGCLLRFSHWFGNRASAPRTAAGWSVCLDALAAAVDGTGPPGNRWVEYHQRYGDELGSEGVLSREGDTAVLRFERVVGRPVEDVWAALTEPDRLGAWLADGTIDATEGGRAELRFDRPPGYVVTGTVTRIDPPKVLEHTWTSEGEPEGSVTWQLIPAGEACLVLFTHTVHGQWDEAGTLAAWHVHLARLATSLAGLPVGPFPDERWSELHDRYAGSAR